MMDNNRSYEMFNHDVDIHNYQGDVEEVKQQFNMSVASLGDLYKFRQDHEEFQNEIARHEYERDEYAKHKMETRSKSPPAKLKKLNGTAMLESKGLINHVYLGESFNPLEAIEVNYLKPNQVKIKKYSHVKGGKIDPPKSHFSIKESAVNKIKSHEENIKPTVLFASPVRIQHPVCEHKRIITSPHEDYDHTKVYTINNNQSQSAFNDTRKISQTKTTGSSRDKLNKTLSASRSLSGKDSRKVLRQVENLYSNIKDFFISSDNKVPSRKGIMEISKISDEVRTSLEKFSKEEKRPKTSFPLKDSVKVQKLKKERKPKAYPQVDNEERKKIEEKLEILHTEMRHVFDNLNNILPEERDVKLKNLLEKASRLSKMIKQLSSQLHKGSNPNDKKQSNPPPAEKDVDRAIDSLKDGMTSLKVVEDKRTVINNLVDSYNYDKTITNMSAVDPKQTNLIHETNYNNFNPKQTGTSNPFAYNLNESIAINPLNELVTETKADFYQSKFYDTKEKLLRDEKAQHVNPYTSNNINHSLLEYNQSFNNIKSNVNASNTYISNFYPRNDQSYNNTHTQQSFYKTKEANLVTSNLNDVKVEVDKGTFIQDERLSSYNVKFPIDYYYNIAKTNEPQNNKEWFIRPHHTETFVPNEKAIGDDILNTKYISYYGEPERQETKKSREEHLSELINELDSNIEKLKYEMFTKLNSSKDTVQLYERIVKLKEDVQKEYEPGKYLNQVNKRNITEILSDRNCQSSYTEMFAQNENISQSNLAIKTYQTLLEQLRENERKLLEQKRKEEYERIRPPVDKWWELKSHSFQEELRRNKMVLNAPKEYFDKLRTLKDYQLY